MVSAEIVDSIDSEGSKLVAEAIFGAWLETLPQDLAEQASEFLCDRDKCLVSLVFSSPLAHWEVQRAFLRAISAGEWPSWGSFSSANDDGSGMLSADVAFGLETPAEAQGEVSRRQ
jgi:hypothetical protein